MTDQAELDLLLDELSELDEPEQGVRHDEREDDLRELLAQLNREGLELNERLGALDLQRKGNEARLRMVQKALQSMQTGRGYTEVIGGRTRAVR